MAAAALLVSIFERTPLRLTRSTTRATQNRFERTLDIVLARRPARHTDAHRRVPLPLRRPAPAITLTLNRIDDAPIRLIVTERDDDLIQHDLVQDRVAGLRQSGLESACVATTAIDHLFETIATEAA